MASLVWSLLWRAVLAEGAAASASFGVIGCTGECGGGSDFGWGCLPWGISDWGGRGFWLVASVGLVWLSGVFWGCMLLPPSGLCFFVCYFSLVVHPWGLCWVT